MDISSDSDNDSVKSVDLNKKINELSNSAKTSGSSSNKNISTTYRLGHLVNDEIHADGFTMKLEQTDKQFKFVMHVTFSERDKPICISVIQQDKRVDQWIWCDEDDIGNSNTITTKQGEVIPLGKRVRQEDMRKNPPPPPKTKNSDIYKKITDFNENAGVYCITSDINVGIPFKMYKKFKNKNNVNQVLGLTVVQDHRKPAGMQGLDAYINDIVIKKRILIKIGEASLFGTEIHKERGLLKRDYPLKKERESKS